MVRKRRFRSLGLAFLALPLMAGCSHAVLRADAVDLLVDGNGYMVDTNTLKLTGNTSFSFRTGDWTYTNLMTFFEITSGLQWQVGGVWKNVTQLSFYPVGDEYNEEYSGYYSLSVRGDDFYYDNILRSGNMVWPVDHAREYSVNTRLYQPDATRPLEFRIPTTISITFNEAQFNTLLSISNFTRSVPPDLATQDYAYVCYDVNRFYDYYSGDYVRTDHFTSDGGWPLMAWPSGGCYGWVIPSKVYYTYSNGSFTPYQADYVYLRADFDTVNPWFDLSVPFAFWFGGIGGASYIHVYGHPLNPDCYVASFDPEYETRVFNTFSWGKTNATAVPCFSYDYYYDDVDFSQENYVYFDSNFYDDLTALVADAADDSHDVYLKGLDDGKIEILNDVSTSTLSYKAGYNAGYNYGYGQGYAEGSTGRSLIFSLFGAVTSVPINVLNGLSPLAIWDTPLISIIITLLFVGLFMFLIKRFFFGGK